MHHWTLITFITIHRRLGLNTVALWITSLWSCATLQARQAKRESTIFIYSQGQAWRSFKYRRSGMHLFTQRITVAEPQTAEYPFVFVCLLCRHLSFSASVLQDVTCEVYAMNTSQLDSTVKSLLWT